jgi:Domain of unknown function (DUF4646)
MTLHMEKQADAASIDGEGPPIQLPAYSETDEHSNADFELVNGPHSPSPSTYMTAEQEKAYLANRDQPDALRNNPPSTFAQRPGALNEQHHTTQQTPSNGSEQPRDAEISTPTLCRGVQIPSCRRKVSSGFPYPDMLNNHGISPREWSNFTSEITHAAELGSKDWTVTVGAGVATFCASGIFIGWLGLIPAFIVGHQLRRSAENKNLRAARDTGDLEAKLLRWNETTFAPRGFLVRLDLPGDEAGDLDRMDVFTPKKWGRKSEGRAASAASYSCGSRWAQKAEKRAQCSKKRMARRGRIVIVPLNGINRSMPEASTEDEKAMGENLAPISEKNP